MQLVLELYLLLSRYFIVLSSWLIVYFFADEPRDLELWLQVLTRAGSPFELLSGAIWLINLL